MHYTRLIPVLLVLACGDSGTAPTTTPTTPTPVATSITLSATTLSFTSMGETKQLSATVKDQNGNTMSGASVAWATSDPSVATVSSAGLVTATANGMATITGTSGSASARASVTVQEEAAALPATEIDSGPATGSTQRESEAAFSFFSDQFDTDFECSLDGGAWSACGMTSEGDFISKVGYTGLGEGGHTFEVLSLIHI